MINLQLPHSLLERAIEAEHVPMAQSLGLGITAWSPLAGGFLTGKYRNTGNGVAGDGRLRVDSAYGSPRPDRTGGSWRP